MKRIDRFGKDLSPLLQKRLWLFDMDGTIYEEEKVFDGTVDLLERIHSLGGEYVFITNNSSKGKHSYIDKVNSMGIPANSWNFYTSVDATVAFLKERHHDELVYCMGTKSMLMELRSSGVRVTESANDNAAVALIGFDTELTYEKLRNASEVISMGIPYYGTNCDLACPASFGFIPDCGSIARLLECSTGRMPMFLGKPEATMVTPLLKRFGCKRKQCVVVGDRLYTDIAVGKNAGIESLCVLTGEATLDEIENSDVVPTYVVDSVRHIADLLLHSSL